MPTIAVGVHNLTLVATSAFSHKISFLHLFECILGVKGTQCFVWIDRICAGMLNCGMVAVSFVDGLRIQIAFVLGILVYDSRRVSSVVLQGPHVVSTASIGQLALLLFDNIVNILLIFFVHLDG